MGKSHHYNVTTTWTGNLGQGTSGYSAYSRNHEMKASSATQAIDGSSDPAFRGDSKRYNPEQLMVAALSSCHMLSMLHLCSDAGIVVTEYVDEASGTMVQSDDGGGQFTEATLRPRVTLADTSRRGEMENIHHRAHELCFIARSVNFPVAVEPQTN